MTTIETTYVLTGKNKGKTVRLGKYPFTDGKLTIIATPEETALHARALERNWSAFPEGSDALKNSEKASGKRDLPEGSQQDGDAEVQGDGVPERHRIEAGTAPSDSAAAANTAARASQGDLTVEPGLTASVGTELSEDQVATAAESADIVTDAAAAQGGVAAQTVDADQTAQRAAENAAGLNDATPGGNLAGENAAGKPKDEADAPKPNEKLRKAIRSLDSSNDAHWTRDGKPAMAAVGEFYGATDFTRADVDAAYGPQYNREAAKAKGR